VVKSAHTAHHFRKFLEAAVKTIYQVILLIGLVLGLAACDGADTASITNGKGTPRANVVYEDDFSNPSSGWETWADANGSFVAYQNGGLRVLVKDKQFDYWSRPGKRFSDARIEVDAVKIAGPNDNDLGLICRYQDKNNFYAFLITSDGYAGILKVDEGKYKVISGTQLNAAPAVRQGEALNHLQADCIGQSLVLKVNGQVAAQAQDAGFSAGEVGVMAGTNANPGVDAFFDNFVVSKP
jgi:hypothetical protein